MSKKIYDMAVKTGSYTDRQTGETRNRYENIGAVMKSDDGNSFVMLKRTFNPAGVPNPDNRDSLLVSLFPPRDQQQAPAQQQRQAAPQQAPDPAGGDPYLDDIPFNAYQKGSEFLV